MPKINSSMISFATYNVRNAVMTVTFTSGARYAYLDVPRAVYAALVAAPSAGSYFNETIRDAYPYEQISR